MGTEDRSGDRPETLARVLSQRGIERHSRAAASLEFCTLKRRRPSIPAAAESSGLRQLQFEEQLRIQIDPLPAHGQMQVGPGRAPRSPAKSDFLPLTNRLAFLDRKFRQMQIERQQTLPVINHHAIAFKEQRPRQDYSSAVDRLHTRSARHAKIEPLMRALHLPVEYALNSKQVRNIRINRISKRSIPFPLGTGRLKSFSLYFLVLCNLALVFRVRRRIARGHLQRHTRVPFV